MTSSLDILIHAWLDGTATGAQLEELSQLLETDGAARQRCLALAEVHALLGSQDALWEKPQDEVPGLHPVVPVVMLPKRKTAWYQRPWAAAAAAALLMLGGITLVNALRKPRAAKELHFATDGPVTSPDDSLVPLAQLKQSTRVRWVNAANPPAPGTALPAGRLVFAEGSIVLEFLSGAQLVVQGPADIELESDNSAWLHRGTATAYVPEPAHGFRLKTARGVVEDLGTSFGLSVNDGQSPEVHVFDGEVEVLPDEGTKMRLTANNAIRLESPQPASVPLRAADFPNAGVIAAEAARASAAQLRAWRSESERLDADPTVAAFFPFLEEHTLPAESVAVGSDWSEGRWPGKPALDFHSRTDRLRFKADGPFPAISLLVWVRVDSLSNDYNALVHPTHYSRGSLHWTLERGGELRLTMLNHPEHPLTIHGWDGPVSAPAIHSMDFGRWIFLATTYDAVSGTVIHYRDGVEAGHGTFQHRLPAMLGDVEFGNWGADGSSPDNEWWARQPAHHRKRHFTGRLDSLVIFHRVLPPEEIRRLSADF